MSSTLAQLQKVSLTAYDCAAVRAAVHAHTGWSGADYLATDMLDGGSASMKAKLGLLLLRAGMIRSVLAMIKRTNPGAEVFMFARTAVPDRLAREALRIRPDSQIVLMGAGLDTSGLRLGAERREAGLDPGRFFEVDLPPTQKEKRRQVERALKMHPGLRQDHITYVPCTFGENELGRALTQAGFEPKQPAVWVWAGVVHYLPESAVRATVAEMRRLSAPRSVLFFDFILLEAYANPIAYNFQKTKSRFDSFGEVMSFGFHEGDRHVGEWLAGHGLKMVQRHTHKDMVALYRELTGVVAPSEGTPWANLCIAEFQ